jgi:hypothetical protein
MHTLRLTLTVATIFCLFVSSYSHASSILFGATHDGRDGDSTLVKINPTTGTATSVGSGLGFERVGALAFDPGSGLLYGTGERMGGSDTHVLITVDTTTGVGTEVGPTGVEGFSGIFGGADTFTDISFNPTDGKLFGFGLPGESIAIIDSGTGAASQIAFATFNGELGFQANDGSGLAFDSAGILFHAAGEELGGQTCSGSPPNGGGGAPGCPDLLHTVDPETSLATILEELLMPVGPADRGRFNAMDFDPETGLLYASIVYGPGDEPANYLGTIDLSTGVVSLLGETSRGLDAIAFVEMSAVPVPAAVWLFGTALVGFIGLSRRRKVA